MRERGSLSLLSSLALWRLASAPKEADGEGSALVLIAGVGRLG